MSFQELGDPFSDEENSAEKECCKRVPLSYNAKVCEPEWFMFEDQSGDPRDAVHYLKYRADLLFRKKHYHQAFVEYEKLLDVISDQGASQGQRERDIWEAQVRCLLWIPERCEEALSLALNLLSSAKNEAHVTSALLLLQRVYHKLGRTREEIDTLQKCIIIHYQSADLWWKLAEAYRIHFCLLDDFQLGLEGFVALGLTEEHSGTSTGIETSDSKRLNDKTFEQNKISYNVSECNDKMIASPDLEERCELKSNVKTLKEKELNELTRSVPAPKSAPLGSDKTERTLNNCFRTSFSDVADRSKCSQLNRISGERTEIVTKKVQSDSYKTEGIWNNCDRNTNDTALELSNSKNLVGGDLPLSRRTLPNSCKTEHNNSVGTLNETVEPVDCEKCHIIVEVGLPGTERIAPTSFNIESNQEISTRTGSSVAESSDFEIQNIGGRTFPCSIKTVGFLKDSGRNTSGTSLRSAPGVSVGAEPSSRNSGISGSYRRDVNETEEKQNEKMNCSRHTQDNLRSFNEKCDCCDVGLLPRTEIRSQMLTVNSEVSCLATTGMDAKLVLLTCLVKTRSVLRQFQQKLVGLALERNSQMEEKVNKEIEKTGVPENILKVIKKRMYLDLAQFSEQFSKVNQETLQKGSFREEFEKTWFSWHKVAHKKTLDKF